MGGGLLTLALASAVFVGAHLLLSHPLRAPLMKAMGENAFLGFYSIIAFMSLGWMALAFRDAPAGTPLWDGTSPLPWLAASLLSLVAMALIAGSLRGNPALPQANVAGLSARKPWGAFVITRHPMMMGIALWALAHAIVAPDARTAILTAAIALLALVGSHLQDRRKIASNGREWRPWMSRTRFWPDWRKLDMLGGAWATGTILWLALTALHLYVAGIPAGVWILTH